MTEAVKRIARKAWVGCLIGYAEETHVILVGEAFVTYSILHDSKGPSEMKLNRLVALLVRTDGKFTARSFLQRPELKPIAERHKYRVQDFFPFPKLIDRTGCHGRNSTPTLGNLCDVEGPTGFVKGIATLIATRFGNSNNRAYAGLPVEGEELLGGR